VTLDVRIRQPTSASLFVLLARPNFAHLTSVTTDADSVPDVPTLHALVTSTPPGRQLRSLVLGASISMDRSNAYFSLLPPALEHLDVDLSRVNHLELLLHLRVEQSPAAAEPAAAQRCAAPLPFSVFSPWPEVP
jgi:hypothetical protein